MRYVSFRRPDGMTGFGRLQGTQIFELSGAGRPGSLRAALGAGNLAQLPDGPVFALDAIELLPPIPDPGKILCVGLNYAKHIAEMGRQQVDYPAIFVRWADTLVADGQPLVCPRESVSFDYEAELAVVIGNGGRRISRDNALDHVAGYAPFNDASVRDWQRHNIQFTPGKNFPDTGGFGPAMVTPDEVADLSSQRVQARLNGELVQDQPVADMLNDVAAIIAYCSTFTRLEPGDVIATGTPGGVGQGRTPPLWMKPGDVIEVSIGSVGTLTNPVVAEAG